MGNRLTDHINSAYINAADRMRPGGKKRRRIVVYVESYDDIAFWRNVLSEFEDGTREFQVMLPSRTNLSRGKKQAITNQLGNALGKSMIACVDADFDYLMQGHTAYSRQLLDNPFIFHTYVYAIENFKCYAPSLHSVVVNATLNDRSIFDFEQYLTAYSRCVYELFVMLVWLYRQQRYSELPLNTFLNIAAVRNLDIFAPERAIKNMQGNVVRKLSALRASFPHAQKDMAALKQELDRLGLTPDNCYLFVQGHHVFDNVCMSALEPVANSLRREREKEIRRLAGGRRQQMENELASYQHSQCDIDEMLRRNSQFQQCPLYQKLHADLQQFFKRFTPQSQGVNQQSGTVE